MYRITTYNDHRSHDPRVQAERRGPAAQRPEPAACTGADDRRSPTNTQPSAIGSAVDRLESQAGPLTHVVRNEQARSPARSWGLTVSRNLPLRNLDRRISGPGSWNVVPGDAGTESAMEPGFTSAEHAAAAITPGRRGVSVAGTLSVTV